MKILSKLPINVISNKVNKLNNSDKISGFSQWKNIVSVDTNQIISQKNKKSYSVKFINYVEPYDINGISYTLFYTEVDHNLSIGDKVFIMGGYYDSDKLIKAKRFKSGSDGYTVQYVDTTRLVLDIEYCGELPWIEEDIDKFIKIYVASTQDEFDYLIQTVSNRGDYSYTTNRFSSFGSYSTNNILYINGTFSVNSGYFGISGFSQSGYSLTCSNSFLVLGGSMSGYLMDISYNILNGTYSMFLSNSLSNNNRIKVMNADFETNSILFKKDYIYYYDSSNSKWLSDRAYMPCFVTEQNFRGGFFKYGQFNQGLLGTNLERINYLGSGVSFTLGTVLNVNWIVGNIGPGNGNTASFLTSVDDFGQPLVKSNSTNNAGKGYNYVYDSRIGKSIISNGNFYNTIIGSQSNSPVLYNDYLSITTTYSVVSYGGYYNNSIIESSLISNSVISNTYTNNSKISKSKSINSEFDRTLFLRSKFTSDNIIKIENYQEGFINWYDKSTLKFFKVYKFYITQSNFNRLTNFKNFYFSGLKITNNKKQNLLNFFDDKFTIGSYDYTYDTNNSKLNKKIFVQLSTKEDNKKSNDIDNYLGTNSNYGLPSIDILVNNGEDFNNEILYRDTDNYTIDISALTKSGDWDSIPVDLTLTITDSDGTNYQYFTISSIIGPSINDNILQGLIGLDVGTFSNVGNIFYVTGTYSYVGFSLTDSFDEYYLSIIERLQTPYINTIGDFVDVSKSYILDSDFKSGLFKDSDWITGNYVNYNKDNAMYTSIPITTNADGLYSAEIVDNTLKLNIKEKNRYKLFDVGDIVFLNSIFSNTTLLGGSNLVKLPSVYKINEYVQNSSDRIVTIEDFINGTSSVISSIPNDPEDSLLSKNSENNYNYIHPVKFQNSNIFSGIFTRSYFEQCIINNELFNSKEKNPVDLSNYRSLLISDTIFSNNNNKINSGTVYNSSLTSGTDTWNNGIFLNSIWNGQSFTYSFSYSSPTYSIVESAIFNDGLFKQSRWVDGVFKGGSFYKNNSNQVGISSVFTNNISAYYRKKDIVGNSKTKYAWIDGTFKGGEFELSNFEDGLFRDGEFYNSNFINGNVIGGVFGKRTIPYTLTKILSGSFSRAKVIGADFKAQNPNGSFIGNYAIDWYSGYFNNGSFGVKIDTDTYDALGLSYSFKSTWYNGEFNGGEFSDISVWKNGKFNGGKFISTYGYPFVTKADYSTATSSLYAWQSGEFNGGEFGTGLTGANSTWYTGEFNGGIFKGRYWNNGIFTNGLFYGSSLLTTKRLNISEFVSNFSDDFYGLWNNGIVSESKDSFIKDKKFYSIIDRNIDRRKKIVASFNNVLWNNGIFSHNDGLFNNSVWLNGSFEKGEFLDSSFNPYLNYIVNSDFTNAFYNWEFNFSDYYNIGSEVVNIANNLVFSGTSSSIIAYQTSGIEIGQVYTAKVTVDNITNAQLRLGNQVDPLYNGNFNTEDNWVLYATSAIPSPTTQLIIATGFAGKLQFTDVDGVSNDAYSLAIYPNVLTVGRQYDVILYVSNYSGSYGVQIGSTKHTITDEGTVIPTANETYETGFLIGNGRKTVTFVPEYEDFTIRIFNTSDDPCYVEINGITVTANKLLTATTIASEVIYNFTFSSYGPDVALEFVELADTVSNDTIWKGSTCSVSNIEIVKGESGFNLSDTCVWNGGVFKNSEFYISKWNGGRWIFGDAYGMIWKDGIADYMNAYNIYWEGGIWKNGNWNGSPFDYKDIVLSNSAVSDGFVSDILTSVALYKKSVNNYTYQDLFLNNVFDLNSDTEKLFDPNLNNGFISVTASIYSGFSLTFNKNWFTSSTYPSSGGSNVTDAGVRTSQFGDYRFTNNLYSDILYAKSNTLDLDIFTSSLYNIEIDYVFKYYSNTDTVSKGLTAAFDIRVGSNTWTPSEVLNEWGGYTIRIAEKLTTNNNYSGFSNAFFASTGKKTIKLTYNPVLNSNSIVGSRRFSLRQIYNNLCTSSNVTLYILRVSIKQKVTNYNILYNNATYSIFSSTPSYLTELELPNLVDYTYQPYFKFGNGEFTSLTNSSIWENGIWNEGIRYDNRIIYFDDLQFFNGTDKPISYAGEYDKKITKIGMISSELDLNQSKINYNNNSWIISIEKISGKVRFQDNYEIDQSNIVLSERFKSGDKVAVGNIVCIDINNNRRLLKDCLTVIDVGIDTNGVDRILLEVIVNFPIRKIEKDSENHSIYISKNIWLNGAFLNGLFKGIWNNGLFKGYPHITKMFDSQWIDGKFDGGHFKGSTMSIEAENDKTYNSSLVQNFIFNDNNVESANLFKYNSWIDVMYFTYSMSNLYRDSIAYDDGFKTNKPILNYNGYPTVDILSSVSSFRNGYNSDSKKYNLGYKSTKYIDYIENYKFEYPVSSTQSFSILGASQFDNITNDYNLSTTHSVPGLFNFIENGWRPLPLNYTDAAEYSANTTFNSQYNNLSKLLVKGTVDSGINLLENLNTISVPEHRYTVVEFGMSFSTSGYSSFNFKFPYLLNAPNGSTEYVSTVPTFVGHNKTSNTNKIEYFYNKPSLQMVLASTLEYSDIYYNVLGDGTTVGLTFSTPHGLIVGDIIYLNKIDKNVDIKIDGTYSVIAVTNPYHITIPSIETNILDGIGISAHSNYALGTDGGIVFLYKPYTSYFDYIKFYEVDMIPFFLYATESRINDSVQVPRKAFAPLISKSDFAIVDSIVLPETLFNSAVGIIGDNEQKGLVNLTIFPDSAS